MSRATEKAARRARRARREYEAAGAGAGCAATAEPVQLRPFDPTDLYLLFGYWSRWTRVRGRVAQARLLATSEDPVDRALREGLAFAGGAPTGFPTPDADYVRLARRADAPRRRGRAAVAIALLLGASGVPRSRGPR